MLSSVRRAAPVGALLTLALLGSACGNSSSSSSGDTTSGSAAAGVADLKGTLAGSGSSFQAPFDEKIIESLGEAAPDLTVTYDAKGSGTGKQELADQKVQFAGTDSTVKDDEKAKMKGGAFLYFPTVAAPITVSYNVSGLPKLQLSPPTLSKIFQAEVTKWDADPIKADNPGVSLPSGDIKVVRRADSSGTTETFTKYLKAADPEGWKLAAASTVEWPSSFVSAPQNGGVAKAIKDTDGAIGYVDFADAKTAGLSFSWIKNKAGTYTEPTLPSTEAALKAATVNPDLTYSALNTAAPDAYPIVASTYILTYEKYTDAAVSKNLKGFLTYILTEGQGQAAEVNFAKLPEDLRKKAQDQVAKITG
jgi:phosphate transport system substrate-binding protein